MRFILFFIFCLGLQYSYGQSIPKLWINCQVEILDDPKVPAEFTYIDEEEEISGFLGIEIRGGHSQSYPKKTYDIEVWEDEQGEEIRDVQFGSLRDDDDWVLDALFNEPLRINSFLSHKIWLDMYSPYYSDQESKAKSGADVMFVEVYLNEQYQGIYMLSEQIDRSLMKLKTPNASGIRGEMYKAVDNDDAVFYNNPDHSSDPQSENWSGFDFEYPSDTINWERLETFIDFVANSSDEDFEDGIVEKVYIDNIINYFMLINLTRGLDNRGKNIYLCKYDQDEPYFFAPWDLDGSWGLNWKGERDSKVEDIITNNLYDRLLETNAGDFKNRIYYRWLDLRGSILSDNSLDTYINDAHQILLENNIYEKEAAVWDYDLEESELAFMKNWLSGRLDYLDGYFDNVTSVSEVESKIHVYPNPVKENLFVELVDANTSFFLTNIQGNVITVDMNVQDHILVVDMKTVSAGLYFLHSGYEVIKVLKL